MEDNNQKNNQPDGTAVGIDPLVTSNSLDQKETLNSMNIKDENTAAQNNENASSVEIDTRATSVTPTEMKSDTMSDSVPMSSVENSNTQPTPPEVATNRKMVLIQYGIATLIVLLMGVGLTYALEQQGRIHTGLFSQVNELIHPTPAVAIVNGVKISTTDYDKNVAQLSQAATAQGADVATDSVKAEIKKQALDVLVNTELLKQAAVKAGITVSEEQIEARRKEIVTQVGGEDKLKQKMVELGITEESLLKDISGEILIQAHLKNAVDTSKVTISDTELKAAYDQIVSGQKAGAVPPLDKIKTQLETQLNNNKQQDLINKYITTLHDGADIKILI